MYDILFLIFLNPPYDINDIVFINAAEDFVVAQKKDCVPEHIKKITDKLGNRYYKVRQKYRRELQRHLANNRNDIYYLFDVIKTSKDAEIQSRCFNVLKRLCYCKECQGTGKNMKWITYTCYICSGSGQIWRRLEEE